MKGSVITIAVLGATVCLLAAMQDPSAQDLAMHRKQLADVSLRVSRLEHAAGAPSGAVDAGRSAAPGENVPRSMIVGGINDARNPPANQDEIEQLNADSDALLDTVNYHKDQAARAAGSTYYNTGYYGDGHYGHFHTNRARSRAEMSQESMANRYSTEAELKRQKAKALQAAAAKPHQVIHGHDGGVIFTLRTKHDLSRELSAISIGDNVTWTGKRIDADDTGETWEIRSIRKIDSD